MKLEVLKKEKDRAVFAIYEINPAIANTIRRYVLEYVPTLAIDEVTFQKNSSALYDEMIAHRLGLIPLKTDLKSYNLKEECKCEGKGCAKCELLISLKVKGPCTVYASELESKDPKVTPIYEKMPIVILLKDQELKFEAKAVLGQGKDHVKFSPGLIYYRGYPELKVTKDSNIKKCLNEMPEGVLVQKGQGVEIKNLLKWNEACEEISERNGIEVATSQENFIFYLESWGQLTPKETLTKAVDIFDEKLDEFEKLVNKIK